MSDQDATLGEFAESSDSHNEVQPRLITGVAWSAIESLPEDWEANNLESNISITTGNNFPSDQFADEGGIPLIRIRDLDSENTTVNYTGEYDDKYLIQDFDLLVGMDGEFEPHFWSGGQALLNQRVCRIEPDQAYNKIFLRYAIEKPLWYIQKSIAGTTVKHLSQSNIRDINLPTPPLEEQRKIASVLYTVDQAIQKTEEIIDQYERVLDGTIQDIATKGIDNENMTERKIPMLPEHWEIPEHWNLEFLENLTTVITDGAHQTPTYVEEGVPFLKIENIKQEEIDWGTVARIPREEHEKLIKSGEPREGDILLSKNGTVGITKVVEWEREFSHFVSLSLIRPQQDRILPDYLATLLESRICMHQAQVRSKKNTVNNLHLEEIRKFSIPVPPIEEQEDILEKISSIQDALSLEKRNQNRLQRLKKGLTQDLLSGEVRTHDKDIEVVDDVLQHG